jgi:hypothetical protein
MESIAPPSSPLPRASSDSEVSSPTYVRPGITCQRPIVVKWHATFEGSAVRHDRFLVSPALCHPPEGGGVYVRGVRITHIPDSFTTPTDEHMSVRSDIPFVSLVGNRRWLGLSGIVGGNGLAIESRPASPRARPLPTSGCVSDKPATAVSRHRMTLILLKKWSSQAHKAARTAFRVTGSH